MASTQNLTVHFPKNRLIFLSFSAQFCIFPRKFLIRNVAFTARKKASALGKLEMVMKQQTLASFHFKYSSNDWDKPSPSTSEENTDACSLSVPDACRPQKTHNASF